MLFYIDILIEYSIFDLCIQNGKCLNISILKFRILILLYAFLLVSLKDFHFNLNILILRFTFVVLLIGPFNILQPSSTKRRSKDKHWVTHCTHTWVLGNNRLVQLCNVYIRRETTVRETELFDVYLRSRQGETNNMLTAKEFSGIYGSGFDLFTNRSASI